MSKVYELAFRMNAEMESRFGRVFDDANKKINTMQRSLRSLDNVGKNGKFGSGIVSSFANIGKAASAALAIGVGGGILAGGAVIKSSLEKAMDFESQLKSIQALTGATDTEMGKMQALALKMGAATKYSALEAAQGIEELLKAGMQPATVQAGGLEAALNLATAGSLDLATAATVMSVSLNSFKKDGLSAAEVANILQGAANASTTGVAELQLGIAAMGSVYQGLGGHLNDAATALGLFTNNGLSAADAGTSFKTMLQNLQPKTKEQISLFKKLGFTTATGANAFFDSAGDIKSLAEVSATLRKSLKGLTNQQRSQTLETLFGTDAIRAANILYDEGADGVKDFQKEMSKVTALDLARKKMDSAAGAVEQFKGAIETLQISALLPTMPIIQKFGNAAADMVTKYTPQITAAMERLIDNSENYLRRHFINNPEFQRIPDIPGKIAFVFDDLGEAFTRWYDATGKDQLSGSVKNIVTFMSDMVTANLPVITDMGTKIGGELALGILKGATEGLFQSKIGKFILKYTPGGWGVQGAAFLTGQQELLYGEGKGYDSSMLPPIFPEIPKLLQGNQASPGGSDNPSRAYRINERAKGGYVTRPEISWIGEGRYPEWVIPQNDSDRSRGLWESAGRSIGALPANGSSGSEGAPINFSPVYNISGGNADEIKRQIESTVRMTLDEFKRMYDEMMTGNRRRSFG